MRLRQTLIIRLSVSGDTFPTSARARVNNEFHPKAEREDYGLDLDLDYRWLPKKIEENKNNTKIKDIVPTNRRNSPETF